MKPLHVHGGAVVRSNALQAGISLVLFPMASLEFFIDRFIPAALCQKAVLSLGDKGGRCVELTTLLHSSAESGNLIIPQPQGPVQGQL